MKRLLFLFLITSVMGQDNSLYVPRNIDDAFYFGTRSYDGKPGENYWVNSADYNISVEVLPEKRMVKGTEIITYFNNSPDELNAIVIKLYQDFYKKGNSRDWQIDPAAVNDGVKIYGVLVNGRNFFEGNSNGAYERYGTNMTIRLSETLKSLSNIELEISWSFTIPFESRLRMGMYDSTSFFISYWYPQVAVYDDIDGWDIFHYKGTTETYNDANNYTVEITTPKNFIVWSTGLLQNSKEVLSTTCNERLEEAKQSNEVINVVNRDDLQNRNFTGRNEKNIWKYNAYKVPDFAFALSDHYLWDATSLEVEPGRRVLIQSAYNEKAWDFYNVAKIARESIEYFSKELPGIPYPYPSMSVFNGHGGMEYPMMVNDGSQERLAETYRLTSHEISHTYFPFYMGINERKYAFMDEGWAVMIPFDFQTEKGGVDSDPRVRNLSVIKYASGQETEMPPIIPNVFLTSGTYRNAAYARPALAYDYLREILGDGLFSTCIKEYISRWKMKHPIPYDFFYTFNNVVGEDLSWFWKPWFFDRGYGDLSIERVFTYEDSYEVFIKKVGTLPLPVRITITYMDGSREKINKTAEVWKSGNVEYVLRLGKEKNIKQISLDDEHTLDINEMNNEVIVE